MDPRYPPITENEKELLKKFRVRIADLNLDNVEMLDIHLVKWIRARNSDLDRAERMLRRSLEWRKSHDFDNILNWETPPNYELYFPLEHTGYDKLGCPITVATVCEWDVHCRREVMEGRKELLHKYLLKNIAQVLADIKVKCSEGKFITQCVIILDLTGFNMRNLTSISIPEILHPCFRSFERNFPESLAVAYVVNAPSLFALLFPVVKKMLAAKTIGKVQLYDGNCTKWKKALLADITPENLPLKYGGILPDTLQKKAQAAKLIASDNGGLGMSGISIEALNTLTINAGNKLTLDYDIKDKHMKISWIFRTDFHDIGFSIIDNLKNEVVPRKRATADTVHEGSYVCPQLGTYSINFDNTYSLFRAKILHYLITVEDAKSYEDSITELTY